MGNHTLVADATDGWIADVPFLPVNLYKFSLSRSVGSGVGGGEGDVIIIINNDELSYNGVNFEF